MTTDVVLVGTIVETFETKQTRIKDSKGEVFKVIVVTCPRRDCGGWFMVPLEWKKLRCIRRGDEKLYFVTKSCPHCFAVSRLPERWWPKHVREKYGALHKQARDYFKSTAVELATGGGRNRRARA